MIVEEMPLPGGIPQTAGDHGIMSVRYLRIIAWIEGVSYLVLLGIAMPLKYLADEPGAVRITGMIHGVLFVLFCAALTLVWQRRRWSILRSSLIFASSLVPCATFFMDRHLARWDSEPISIRS
jgi:integral membrane protein